MLQVKKKDTDLSKDESANGSSSTKSNKTTRDSFHNDLEHSTLDKTPGTR